MFIDDPKSRNWSECDCIEALKMRSNVSVTRELMARTVTRGHDIVKTCRRCGTGKTETLHHILSNCAETQSNRVRRHDAVKDYLFSRLGKILDDDGLHLGARVIKEKPYKIPLITPNDAGGCHRTQLLRPDISLEHKNVTYLFEVSVVYEAEVRNGYDSNTLKKIRREKLAKYKPLAQHIVSTSASPDHKCIVRPLIVGCRGGWLASNNKILHGLDRLTQLDRNCLVERAVRGSVITYRRFNHGTREALIRYRPAVPTVPCST